MRQSPHSPIEREIERSERASAALAAARALARASFTDSQLAADDAAADGDIDTAELDPHRVRARWISRAHRPQDDARAAAPRNLVGGSFNPGIASQHGARVPGRLDRRTRRSRPAPARRRASRRSRATRRAPNAARAPRRPTPASVARYDKPAVVPMLAPSRWRPRAGAGRRRGARRVEPANTFVAGGGLGAVVVLVGGGVAWKAGLLSHAAPTTPPSSRPRSPRRPRRRACCRRRRSEIAITPAAGADAAAQRRGGRRRAGRGGTRGRGAGGFGARGRRRRASRTVAALPRRSRPRPCLGGCARRAPWQGQRRRGHRQRAGARRSLPGTAAQRRRAPAAPDGKPARRDAAPSQTRAGRGTYGHRPVSATQ